MPDILFLTRIHNGDRLVADGATGTNLIARGLPAGLTPESWVVDNPDALVQLHKEFIASGADILLTSTFNASSHRLANSPLEGKTLMIVRKAVELARNAIGEAQVYIAGSLGPVGALMKPYGPLSVDEVIRAYTEQAEAHIAAGSDLLVIETQFDLAEVKAAIQGVRQAGNLPLVVSLSYDRGRRTMMGISPTQAANELNKLPVDLIGINCGHSLEENFQDLVELKEHTDKPIWFKPNAGLPHLDPSGNTIYDVTPQAMGSQVHSWLESGAQVVGGCCGTTPAHLEMIAKHSKM